MIRAVVFRNQNDLPVGFEIKGHGESIACAAVSMLAINTANAIETLTDARFDCRHDSKGGDLCFKLTDDSETNADAVLLLKALVLGLESVKQEYEKEIQIKN